MALNVAVQMDPIDKINIAGDSTFALLLEARARGHKLLYYTPDKLSLSEGRVVAGVEQELSFVTIQRSGQHNSIIVIAGVIGQKRMGAQRSMGDIEKIV